ncbi:MAG TPA: helix-turn-helix domain-containing protein [Magnetospirillaceae bacterium]|jgi:transcriptional regulator with XRE-family HTH domain
MGTIEGMSPRKGSQHLSTTLRRLRKAANLTLEAAAGRADVTKGYLSKVELGASIPSIAVVGRLAQAYGVELSDVFLQPGKKGPFSLVRANERTRMNRNGTEYGYTYEVASLNKANPRSEIFFLTLPCVDHASLPKLRHPGEEIIFLLEGKMRFDFAGTVFILEPGDCIQFEASYEHLGVAIDGKDAKALLVITPEPHEVPSKREGRQKPKTPARAKAK